MLPEWVTDETMQHLMDFLHYHNIIEYNNRTVEYRRLLIGEHQFWLIWSCPNSCEFLLAAKIRIYITSSSYLFPTFLCLFYTGELINEIVQQIKDNISGDNHDVRMYIYSAVCIWYKLLIQCRGYQTHSTVGVTTLKKTTHFKINRALLTSLYSLLNLILNSNQTIEFTIACFYMFPNLITVHFYLKRLYIIRHYQYFTLVKGT